jgi:hypothetical protein
MEIVSGGGQSSSKRDGGAVALGIVCVAFFQAQIGLGPPPEDKAFFYLFMQIYNAVDLN